MFQLSFEVLLIFIFLFFNSGKYIKSKPSREKLQSVQTGRIWDSSLSCPWRFIYGVVERNVGNISLWLWVYFGVYFHLLHHKIASLIQVFTVINEKDVAIFVESYFSWLVPLVLIIFEQGSTSRSGVSYPQNVHILCLGVKPTSRFDWRVIAPVWTLGAIVVLWMGLRCSWVPFLHGWFKGLPEGLPKAEKFLPILLENRKFVFAPDFDLILILIMCRKWR